jgi:hypothetical protein
MNARVPGVVAAAASLWLAAGNAVADDHAVSVTFVGQLPPKCVLNNTNSVVELGQLSPRGSASAAFTLSCNADFHFKLRSQSGGLVQQGATTQPKPPFIALIPYAVSLSLGQQPISDGKRCQSRTMTEQHLSCFGAAHANVADPSGQNASLSVSWDFSGAIPLAGSYRDTLVLTVGPDF